jgi:penicillin amidase
VVPLEPVGGGSDTVNVAPVSFFDGGEPREQLITQLMALYRMVIGFGEDGTPEATVDFARGTREDPESPYFSDQKSTWAAAEHVVLPVRRADVEAGATERATIGGRK